jgi:hypothetical protein
VELLEAFLEKTTMKSTRFPDLLLQQRLPAEQIAGLLPR